MNILILEDERNAAIRLTELLKQAEPNTAIVGVLERVVDAISWLSTNAMPDLILSDIQLADGLSFEVFKKLNLQVPVIFTTAYDEYTLNAFKHNSIDYLLKPIDIDELKAAFVKYRTIHKTRNDLGNQLADLFKTISNQRPEYKSRFLIRRADQLVTVAVADIGYIKADDKVVFLFTTKGEQHIIDDSLDELENTLDLKQFFRINRTYFAPLASIEKINNHFNGRLKITIRGCKDNEIYVSKARASEFKAWLNK